MNEQNHETELQRIIYKKFEGYLAAQGFVLINMKPKLKAELHKVFTAGFTHGGAYIIEAMKDEMKRPVSEQEVMQIVQAYAKAPKLGTERKLTDEEFSQMMQAHVSDCRICMNCMMRVDMVLQKCLEETPCHTVKELIKNSK